MFPQSMPMSELRPDDLTPELAHTLEEHLVAGFPPDLALDLVLNELVSQAAHATRAGGAALALTRGDAMVCRAATGQLAPGLGVTLNSSAGLSGACLQSRQPQLSLDTEVDPRVDQTASRLLGIRSILIVPVFRAREDAHEHEEDAHGKLRRGDPITGNSGHGDGDQELMGILEVFSAVPGAFSESDERLLQGFAEECARIRLVATELTWHKPAADSASDSNDCLPPPLPYNKSAVSDTVATSRESDFPARISALNAPELLAPEDPGSETLNPDLITSATASEIEQGRSQTIPVPLRTTGRRLHYEGWSLVLGGLAIAIALAVSFLIGSRIGWLRRSMLSPGAPPPSSAANTNPCFPGGAGCQGEQTGAGTDRVKGARASSEKMSPRTADGITQKAKDKSADSASPGELVIYEKGKVVFRMKPAPAKGPGATAEQSDSKPPDSAPTNGATVKSANGIVAASSTTRMASFQSVWLAPEEAEGRLLTRVEPKFPAEALNSHLSGTVILEVQVAEDGTVSNIRTLSGDPLLANAATDAVRQWRYQPYRQHDRPSQFQTHVTLNFTLPN
jgi:TonB family protein